MRRLSVCVALLVATLLAGPAAAQEKPRAGGELVFVVPAEPPSYDAHREDTFALIHPAAPHYNTLLRTDPADRSDTRIDDETHYLTTLQWHRIVVHNAKVRGWTVTPSHYLDPAARHRLAGRIAEEVLR